MKYKITQAFTLISSFAFSQYGNLDESFNDNGYTIADLSYDEYTLTSSQPISVELYNLQGELVKTVSNEFEFAGNYTKALDISKISSGGLYYNTSNITRNQLYKFVKN